MGLWAAGSGQRKNYVVKFIPKIIKLELILTIMDCNFLIPTEKVKLKTKLLTSYQKGQE